MHIEIAERIKPFSHAPGIFFVLPGTSYRLQVFPACFKIEDLSEATPKLVVQLNMNIQGPLDKFTVEQDLEKGTVRIWGISAMGLFRYLLKPMMNGSGVIIVIEKAPSEGVPFQSQGIWSLETDEPLRAGERRLLTAPSQLLVNIRQWEMPLIDRLSLGNHKSQDWELMRRRRDFAEIFPIWHRLGQLIPKPMKSGREGMLALFDHCKQAIAASSPEHILSHFEKLFLAGFEGGLSPRLFDSDFHGIVENEDNAFTSASPLQLLAQGAELIRSLFVQYDANSISLLPACPPFFHCGRLINVDCGLGIASLEWTKKSMRCMNFLATTSKTIMVSSRDRQRCCRIRQSSKDRGISYQLGSSLEVIAGQNYWFDNFIS